MSNKKTGELPKKIEYYWNTVMVKWLYIQYIFILQYIQPWKSNNNEGGKINLLNLFERKVYNHLLQLTLLPWKTLLCHLHNEAVSI